MNNSQDLINCIFDKQSYYINDEKSFEDWWNGELKSQYTILILSKKINYEILKPFINNFVKEFLKKYNTNPFLEEHISDKFVKEAKKICNTISSDISKIPRRKYFNRANNNPDKREDLIKEDEKLNSLPKNNDELNKSMEIDLLSIKDCEYKQEKQSHEKQQYKLKVNISSCDPKDYPGIDIYDETFYFGDFTAKWQGVVLDDNQIIPMLIDARRVYAYIISSNGKSYHKVSKREPLKGFSGVGNFSFLYKTPSGKIIPYSFQNMIKHQVMYHWFVYKCLVFEPYPPGITPPISNGFNLFRGFKAKLVDKVDLALIQPVLDHFAEGWSGSNKEWNHFILSWFSAIFKTPHIKTNKALVLASGQGAGKDVIKEFFEQYIFGTTYAITVIGVDKIAQRFNSVLLNKLLITINELSSAESLKSTFNRMKDIITGRFQAVELKGCETEYVNDCCNYLMFSNNSHAIDCDDDDRRYAMPDVSNKFVDDDEYWERLCNLIKNKDEAKNQHVANHLFTYLFQYEGMDVKPKNSIPKSITKQNMISCSLVSSKAFIKGIFDGFIDLYELMDHNNLLNNEYIYFRKPLKNTKNIKNKKTNIPYITTEHLHEVYVKWCELTRAGAVKLAKFGQDISEDVKDRREQIFVPDLGRYRCIALPLLSQKYRDIYVECSS